MFIFCSWISSRSLIEAISIFLLLFSDMVLFVEWSYSSITCPNLSIYLSLSFSTATIDFDRNPTVHSLVLSWTRTALMASSGFYILTVTLLSSSTHPINNCQFETKNVGGNSKYTTAVVLATRSPISRCSKAKNFPKCELSMLLVFGEHEKNVVFSVFLSILGA